MALGAKEAHRTSLTQMLLKCCYLCGEHPLIWLYITSVVTMVLCLLGTQLHNSLITAALQRVWSKKNLRWNRGSEKTGSCRESNPGQLACAASVLPLSCNNQTTISARLWGLACEGGWLKESCSDDDVTLEMLVYGEDQQPFLHEVAIPSLSHPSAADEAWYWPQHHLLTLPKQVSSSFREI